MDNNLEALKLAHSLNLTPEQIEQLKTLTPADVLALKVAREIVTPAKRAYVRKNKPDAAK